MININDKIDLWHTGHSDLPLYLYLGMTLEEYAFFVEKSEIPERLKDTYFEA